MVKHFKPQVDSQRKPNDSPDLDKVFCVLLHMVEGIHFYERDGETSSRPVRPRESIIMNASLNSVNLEIEGTPSATTPAIIFNSNCIWECDMQGIKRIKTDNRPVKVAFHATNSQAERKLIGNLVLPVRGLPIIGCNNNNSATQLKMLWHKLICISNEFRAHKPEVLLILAIVKKALLRTKEFEHLMQFSNGNLQRKSPRSASLRSPGRSITSNMLQSQANVYVHSLVQLGLLQVGNDPMVDCDIIEVVLQMKELKNVNALVKSLSQSKQMDSVVLVFDFVGNVTNIEIKLNNTDAYALNDVMGLRFKSSLRSIRLYFQRIFYLPINMYVNGIAIANYRMDFGKLLPKDDYFAETNQFVCNGLFEFDRLGRMSSSRHLKPILEYTFSVDIQTINSLQLRNNQDCDSLNVMPQEPLRSYEKVVKWNASHHMLDPNAVINNDDYENISIPNSCVMDDEYEPQVAPSKIDNQRLTPKAGSRSLNSSDDGEKLVKNSSKMNKQHSALVVNKEIAIVEDIQNLESDAEDQHKVDDLEIDSDAEVLAVYEQEPGHPRSSRSIGTVSCKSVNISHHRGSGEEFTSTTKANKQELNRERSQDVIGHCESGVRTRGSQDLSRQSDKSRGGGGGGDGVSAKKPLGVVKKHPQQMEIKPSNQYMECLSDDNLIESTKVSPENKELKKGKQKGLNIFGPKAVRSQFKENENADLKSDHFVNICNSILALEEESGDEESVMCYARKPKDRLKHKETIEISAAAAGAGDAINLSHVLLKGEKVKKQQRFNPYGDSEDEMSTTAYEISLRSDEVTDGGGIRSKVNVKSKSTTRQRTNTYADNTIEEVERDLIRNNGQRRKPKIKKKLNFSDENPYMASKPNPSEMSSSNAEMSLRAHWVKVNSNEVDDAMSEQSSNSDSRQVVKQSKKQPAHSFEHNSSEGCKQTPMLLRNCDSNIESQEIEKKNLRAQRSKKKIMKYARKMLAIEDEKTDITSQDGLDDTTTSSRSGPKRRNRQRRAPQCQEILEMEADRITPNCSQIPEIGGFADLTATTKRSDQSVNTDPIQLISGSASEEIEQWKAHQMELFQSELARKELQYIRNLEEEEREQNKLDCAALGANIEHVASLEKTLINMHKVLIEQIQNNVHQPAAAVSIDYENKFQAMEQHVATLKSEMEQQLRQFEIRNEEIRQENAQLTEEKSQLRTRIAQMEEQIAQLRCQGLSGNDLKQVLIEMRSQNDRFLELSKSNDLYKKQWRRCARRMHSLKMAMYEKNVHQEKQTMELNFLNLKNIITKDAMEFEREYGHFRNTSQSLPVSSTISPPEQVDKRGQREKSPGRRKSRRVKKEATTTTAGYKDSIHPN